MPLLKYDTTFMSFYKTFIKAEINSYKKKSFWIDYNDCQILLNFQTCFCPYSPEQNPLHGVVAPLSGEYLFLSPSISEKSLAMVEFEVI